MTRHSVDPVSRVRALDVDIAAHKAHHGQMLDLQEKIGRQLAALDDKAAQAQLTRSEQDSQSDLRRSLVQLERGIHRAEGVIPALVPFVGKLGISDTEKKLDALRREHAEWAAKIGRDPDERTPYRYTGPPRKHSVDGRYVECGEVVLLTSSQFEHLRDRFTPIAEDPSPA